MYIYIEVTSTWCFVIEVLLIIILILLIVSEDGL